MISSKSENNIQNLFISYCIFDHRKLNLIEIRHIFLQRWTYVFQNKTNKCDLDLDPLTLISSMLLSLVIKGTLMQI